MAWLTVMVPLVALIVTAPPSVAPMMPLLIPFVVSTVPTITSSTSVNEITPGPRSAAKVSTSLPALSRVNVPSPSSSRS